MHRGVRITVNVAEMNLVAKLLPDDPALFGDNEEQFQRVTNA